MLLAIDIGNTNIVVALFKNDEIVQEWRFFSSTDRTADEYKMMINSFFHDAKIDISQITNGILSSVVPLLVEPFINLMETLIGKKPVLVCPAIYDKLPVKPPITAVAEIGTDLMCNAVQALTKYNGPCIVVDFGTALTFTSIDKTGQILGVAIAPGIKTAVNSLFSNTAQLPSVPLEIPENALGTNTIHSIQAGILYGYKGLVESLITQIKSDMEKICDSNSEQIKVIATGGLHSVLKPLTNIFDITDKSLTLDGLNTIAEILQAI